MDDRSYNQWRAQEGFGGVKTPSMTWPTKKISPCNLAYIMYLFVLQTAKTRGTVTGITLRNIRTFENEFNDSCY